MKFTINANDLKGHLDVLKSVVNTKNVIQILDNYLFEQKNGLIKISATDLETRIDTIVTPNSSEGEGTIAINAKQLTDMLGMFGNEQLTFTIDLERFSVLITTASGKYKVAGCSGDEYPQQQIVDGDSFSVDSAVLARGVEKTMFATNDDVSRPTLSGVLFEIHNESLRFVATDTHKLSRYTKSGLNIGVEKSIIVPMKTCAILKAIASRGGDVKVMLNDSILRVSCSSYAITTKLIQGKFPNYCAVIPQDGTINVSVDKKDFISRLKRVSYFSNPSNNLTKMKVDNTQLFLTSQDLDRSNSADEVLGCEHSGDNIEIGFQSKYLLCISEQIDSDKIVFNMSEKNRAALVQQDSCDENEDFLMLIMPMMI